MHLANKLKGLVSVLIIATGLAGGVFASVPAQASTRVQHYRFYDINNITGKQKFYAWHYIYLNKPRYRTTHTNYYSHGWNYARYKVEVIWSWS
ncbi:hypothetical protein [Lactiplantibacillus mudanjiangensis]|uniref:Uncharacterized protein n=1 Tax=Lactiplantibacillus mudanjiangensis TaxID=1296538 RepID=A0A660DWB0_9LACO|nr:hypothetical protein [Lactiplantibacillus mudanjiangensis]VDG25392.1 hypothetical protein MUDAN_IGPPGNFN_01130 [Lactiplantibacillus mudanjiangensis]VDG27576.1 hypothetical protein MUDAN_MDHGFNIF_02423 [Lactiplantibacillus mudanjiangensis]